MDLFFRWAAGFEIWIVPGLIISMVVLLFLSLLLIRGVRRTDRRLRAFFSAQGNGNLEQMLLANQQALREVATNLARLEQRIDGLDAVTSQGLMRSALVRFQAFKDTGSDLSFAWALIDGGGNGVVVCSLYGREESRIYAKPVQTGASVYHLTEEEKQAIQMAMEQHGTQASHGLNCAEKNGIPGRKFKA